MPKRSINGILFALTQAVIRVGSDLLGLLSSSLDGDIVARQLGRRQQSDMVVEKVINLLLRVEAEFKIKP